MSELNEKIRQQLMEWAETDFGTFSAGLIPGEKHVLGAVSYTHLTLPTN